MAAGAGCGGGGSVRQERAGEMVFYGITYDIRGFDPIRSGDVETAIAVGKIYEGLLQYSYLERPYRVEPSLAESLPDVSPDGLVYTFKIRKGIYFQDDPCFTNSAGKGRELVARDFVYSLKRVADIKSESTGYWIFNERIAGLDAFRKASASSKVTDFDADVEGLQAPDRYTFRLKLLKPYPQLLWTLTMNYAFVVPREALEYYKGDFVNHPVGTGPYILKSWRKNYRLEYTRNPKWAETGRVELYPSKGAPGDAEKGLLADAGKRLPFIDRIISFVITDPSTQWLKFVTGEIESSGVSRDNWDAVVMGGRGLTESLVKMKVKLFTAPSLDTAYFGFNMDDPIVGSNKKLRQALSCAFNTGEWINYNKGHVVRAVGPIPPGVAGYVDKPSPYPFDLDRARKLLAEAGYPEGIDEKTGKRLQLTILVGSGSDPDIREQMEVICSFMKKIGVILTADYNNWPSFLEKIERRQAQMYRLAWIADYPDAENFLQLFYGPNSSPNPNHSNYVNPEFDRLYENIRTMPDGDEKTGICVRMAEIIIEDCPWIFLHHTVSYGLNHHWVNNFKPNDFPYGMDKYRSVDVNARRKWIGSAGAREWR